MMEIEVKRPQLQDEYGYTVGGKALVRASERGHLDIVNYLITAGVDLNKELQDVYGYTVGGKALVRALETGHLDIMNYLITAGVDLNKELKYEYGNTVGGKALVIASERGHLHIVNTLITAGVDLSKELNDEYGNTVGGKALERCSEEGHLHIINYLSDTSSHYLKINDCFLHSYLQDVYGYTVGGKALVRALETGHLDIMNYLITAGVDLNKELKDEYGNTVGGKALVIASERGHLHIVNTLITAGVDLSKELKDEYGYTVGGKALVRASKEGHLDIVNYLITAGVDLSKELKNEYGNTVGGNALVAASKKGHLYIVNALITAGVDLSKELKNEYGNTVGGNALVAASKKGHLYIVNALITAGVDLSKELKDEFGSTVGENALVEASYRGHLDIVNALITAGLDLNEELKNEYGNTVGGNALVAASKKGHLYIVNALITAGVDLSKELKDEFGSTVGKNALVEASYRGHLDIVNALITAGLDLNEEDKNGDTVGEKAYITAAGGGHLHIMKVFIASGVDINKEDENGKTVGVEALEMAARRGQRDIVNALIGAGVDVHKTDKEGETVGEKALKAMLENCKDKHFDIVIDLMKTGVDVNKEYVEGRTFGENFLIKAAKWDGLDFIKSLIEAGVDVNKKYEKDRTVGEEAIKVALKRAGNLEVVTYLIKIGVDITKEDVKGRTFGENSFMQAAKWGNLDCLKNLIEAGVDVNEKYEKDRTVGEEAIKVASDNAGYQKDLEVVIYLVKKIGVDITKEDVEGRTFGENSFMQAAKWGNLDCLKTLIEAGVDVNKKYEKDRTVGEEAIKVASDYAGYQKDLEVVSYLVKIGVDITKENEEGKTVGEQATVAGARWGHLEWVNSLITAGVDLNKLNEKGETVGGQALEAAAAKGKTDMVNVLVDMGVDLKDKNEKGETVGGQALEAAAAEGQTDMVNVLVDMGVDLKEENEKGESVGGQALVQAVAAYCGADVVNLLIGLGVDLSEENGTVGEGALFKVLERDVLNRNHLKIVDTFVRQEVHINKRDICIEACKKKIKQLQKVMPNWWDQKTEIAIRYKIYELLTGKTKEVVIETMTRDMEQTKDSKHKSKYKDAITCYKDDIPAIIKEVRLNEEQEMQMAEAFASGSERDFCARSNFVGFTGAGKTTLMWQLFLILFSPKDIESTNGIDISLGYCSIDLRTEQWKRHKESAGEKRARRFRAIAVDKKEQRDKDNTSDIAIDLTKPGCSGIQTQQQRQQRMSDNSRQERKSETIREPTEVSVRETSIPIPAKPPTTKTDRYSIVRRITQAETKAGRREQEANATGIDYAGQATYYALHQLFLSKRGVNIIVMDGSKDFDEAVLDDDIRHIGSKHKANSKDFFRFWANSLRYYLPERSSKHIITVFTHKDLVLNQDDLQKKICIVKEMIEDMGMTELFFEKVLCVNGNDPNDQVLQELRHIILQFSKGENHWGQEMPSSWLLLEDKLMQRKAAGHQVMTLDEVNEMNLKSALPLRSQDELLLFLKIHHEIGTLMYFTDVRAMKITILNPQWLIDCLKSVICAKRFRDPRYIKQWDRLHEKGLVEKAFLYSVWESTPGRFFEFREDLILLMNKLDLISSPKTYDEKGDYISSPYFIVPCMLHPAPENFLQKYQNAATHRNLPIAFEFIHGFLPTATAYRMLATCVMEFGELKKEETIYCDCAVFKVFEHHYMTLEFTSSSIIANVLTFGKTQASIGVCKAVRGFLEDAMKCIISSQRISTNYSLLVACGYEDKHHKPAWLKWSTLMQQPEIICEEHRNEPPHVVKTAEILKQWSLVRSEEERLQNKRRKIHDSPIPEEKPDQLYLGRISRRIPSKDFHLLFLELGLNENDIDSIKRKSPDQCILFLLLEWARRPGSTYKQLADALYEHLSYVFDIEEMQSYNCEWRADMPGTFLKKEVSDSTDLEFDNVCFMAGSSYFELGLELGLMKPEIDAIKRDNEKCVSIAREIIKSWINKNRPDDTWEVLGDALYEVGEDPHFIKSMCNASQNTPQ